MGSQVQPEDSGMEIWAGVGSVEVKLKAVFIVLQIPVEIAPDIYMLSTIVGSGMSLTSLIQVNGKTSCDCGVIKSKPVVVVQGGQRRHL